MHRSFARTEVVIACILNAFASQGVPIGRLLTVSLLVRPGLKDILFREVIEDALAARGHNFLVYVARPQEATDEQMQQSIRAAASMPAEIKASAITMLENPVALSIWSSNKSKTSLEEELTRESWTTALSIVCVNLNACLAGAKEELSKG